MAIVCHCEVVRERTIVKAIHRGASTLSDVQQACGAAMRCHGCEQAVCDLLNRHSALALADSATSPAPYAVQA